MNENHQSPYDDEIDLRDIIKSLWKNKTVIVLGTVIATFLGVGVNFFLPNVYRANMVLKPGILEVDKVRNKIVYIESPENIKAGIELGSYDSKIIEMLSKNSHKLKASEISYTIKVPKNADYIKVSTDHNSGEVATSILTVLTQILTEEYHQKSDRYKSNFQREIEIIKGEIERNELEASRRQNYIRHSELRIEALSEDVQELVQYSKQLSEAKVITQPSGKDKIEGYVYKDFEITQNVAMINDLKTVILNDQTSRSNEVGRLLSLNSKIHNLKSELNQVTISIDNVQNIQVLQQPELGPNPVKPKKARNLLVAFMAGLFLSIIFVFLKQAIRSNGVNTVD